MSTIEAQPYVDSGSSPFSRDVGAVILGGDYQGLGIARSVGRHGVPVVVVDDERSITRLSRYCTSYERIADMGDEDRVIDDLLRIARERGLEGWVLYPTRDETVAAIARNRERLSEVFRVVTAPWDAVRWAWDKRNTASIAAQVGVPAPRSWQPADLADVDQIDGDAAVGDQAGDQGALLLRHQGEGMARRQPRGAAHAASRRRGRSPARAR